MRAKFTIFADARLVDFYESMGPDFLSKCDGILREFTEPQLRRRAKKLKDTGAWDVLKQMDQLNTEYFRRLGLPVFEFEDEVP